MHVGRIDAREVALLQQGGHLRHQPPLHDRALLRAEGAGLQQIAVGAERLIGLLEREQLHGIGVAAPVIEIAHEAARLHGVAVGPQAGGRQPVHEGMAGDGQELLAAVAGSGPRVGVLHGDRDGAPGAFSARAVPPDAWTSLETPAIAMPHLPKSGHSKSARPAFPRLSVVGRSPPAAANMPAPPPGRCAAPPKSQLLLGPSGPPCRDRHGRRPRACPCGSTPDIGFEQHQRPTLVQARAAEAFQIVLPVGILLNRHLARDPGERNIGLRAAQLLECGGRRPRSVRPCRRRR